MTADGTGPGVAAQTGEGAALLDALVRAYYEPLGWDVDDLDPDDLRDCTGAMGPVASLVREREAAHARVLAALRERAEVAEAKVAAVCVEVDRRWPAHEESMIPNALRSQTHRAVLLRALADRPAGGEGR